MDGRCEAIGAGTQHLVLWWVIERSCLPSSARLRAVTGEERSRSMRDARGRETQWPFAPPGGGSWLFGEQSQTRKF